MKKYILLSLLLFNLSFIASAQNEAAIDVANVARYAQANQEIGLPQKGEHRVVFMGNSITDYWPNVRPEFFKDNNLIGRGISGQTSDQFLLRFENDVIALKPAVVVINYGTNDIAENRGRYVEDQTLLNVKAMCEIAKACGIKVVLASTLPHEKFLWRDSITNVMDKVVSLNERVKAFAKENKIVYVDYFSSMVSQDGTMMRPELSKDGVHPNAEGYKIMEDIILPIVTKLRK